MRYRLSGRRELKMTTTYLTEIRIIAASTPLLFSPSLAMAHWGHLGEVAGHGHLVAAGLAEACELEVAYAIGHPYPTSIHVDTFGTGVAPDTAISEAAQKVFSFKPADIVSQLDLLRPIYRESTNYGHFAKDNLPWESTAKADELKAAL